jgi:hypothetical protein
MNEPFVQAGTGGSFTDNLGDLKSFVPKFYNDLSPDE